MVAPEEISAGLHPFQKGDLLYLLHQAPRKSVLHLQLPSRPAPIWPNQSLEWTSTDIER